MWKAMGLNMNRSSNRIDNYSFKGDIPRRLMCDSKSRRVPPTWARPQDLDEDKN
jgi:hypothetical protein